MKHLLPVLQSISIILLLMYTAPSFGQEPELQEYVDDMKSLLSDVEAHGKTFRQKINSPSPGKVEITVNEINDKGGESETRYDLALSDINPRAVRSFTSRDVKMVEIVANGKQKLIKKSWEGGDKIAYVPDFILYALDDDNGVDLKQAFQESVPFALEVEKKGFALESYEEHLNWLMEHIGPVQLSDEKVVQRLSSKSSGGDVVQFEQVKGSEPTTATFNLSQLNPNTMEFHISGDEIFIEIRTKGGMKTIKHSVDGALKDYRDILTVYANSPDALKKIQSVLKNIIPLAEKEFKNAKPELTSTSDMLDYVNKDIKVVTIVDGRMKQHLDVNDDTATLSIEEISEKRNLVHEYVFSLSDINATGIKTESTKSRIFLELGVKNGEPFIRHTENGEPQNYTHYVRLYFDSRQDATNAKEGLKTLIKQLQAEKEEADNNARFTLKKGWANLETLVTNVENNEIGFEQNIEMVDEETSALTFSKTVADRKNIKELVYEFGAKEMNPYAMKVNVSRSRVWVELITRNKKKTIKLTEDGELQNYQYAVEIEATSIANAKDILKNLKKLSELYEERIGQ